MEKEPKEYLDKYLYDDNFEYGEIVSPLSLHGIQIGSNPLKYITKDSKAYMEKYKIPIVAYNYDSHDFDDLENLEVIE